MKKIRKRRMMKKTKINKKINKMFLKVKRTSKMFQIKMQER